MGKVFVGLWIDEDVRKKIKVACTIHNVNQSDVMELLIERWVNSPNIKEDVKEFINGKNKSKKE